MRSILRTIFVLAILAAVPAAESIIAHDPGHGIAINESEIRAMFVGRRTSWPDGRNVIVVVATDGPANDGLMRHLGKSSQQFLNGWKKLMFSGNGSMPKLLAGDQEVATYVAQTPGAIGYIACTPPAGVLVLMRTDPPGE